MDLNRNQFFMIGLILLLFGLQFRLIESYTLNEKASRFLSERSQATAENGDSGMQPFFAAVGPVTKKTIHPPEWLGWFLISVGSVLMLHSLVMPKPGG